MGNTIEFIKKHSPIIGNYAESLANTLNKRYLESNELLYAFRWDDDILGYGFWESINYMDAEQLQALERIYNPNFKPKLSLQEIADKAGITEEELIDIFKEELVK